MLASFTAGEWAIIIGLITGSIIAILTPIFAFVLALVNKKLNSIEKTGKDTHTLANSAMGVQLLSNKELSRWKADQTKNPSDLEAAINAENRYLKHMEQQAVVDAGDDAKG